ncbi:MAG: TrmH family RNA methyltransferase [Bacillota bacterium]
MNIINSLNNKKIIETNKLKQKKYRQLYDEFLVEGYHLIEEAYQAGVLKTIFYSDKNPYNNIENYQVNNQIIAKLSTVKNNQGIVGICKIHKLNKLTNKILLLDRIQDPGNIGTLIRSAIAFGYHTIILDQCVDIYNPKVIRATQGAIFRINVINEEISAFIQKNKDYYFLATNLNSNNYLKNFKINSKKVGLILGNEGSGVRDNIISLANDDVKIRMGKMESLNVSIAGSILMYGLKLEE